MVMFVATIVVIIVVIVFAAAVLAPEIVAAVIVVVAAVALLPAAVVIVIVVLVFAPAVLAAELIAAIVVVVAAVALFAAPCGVNFGESPTAACDRYRSRNDACQQQFNRVAPRRSSDRARPFVKLAPFHVLPPLRSGRTNTGPMLP